MSVDREEPQYGDLTELDIRSIRLRCIELAQEHTTSDDVVRLAGEWSQFILNGSPVAQPAGGSEESARANGEAWRSLADDTLEGWEPTVRAISPDHRQSAQTLSQQLGHHRPSLLRRFTEYLARCFGSAEA